MADDPNDVIEILSSSEEGAAAPMAARRGRKRPLRRASAPPPARRAAAPSKRARRGSEPAVVIDLLSSDEDDEEVVDITHALPASRAAAREFVSDFGDGDDDAAAAASMPSIAATATAAAAAPSPPMSASLALSSAAAASSVDVAGDVGPSAAAPAPTERVACGMCRKPVPLKGLYSSAAVQLEGCGCIFCSACFKSKAVWYVTNARLKPEARPCPSRLDSSAAAAAAAAPRACGGLVSDADLRNGLQDKYWQERLDAAVLDDFLSNAPGMLRCPGCKCWVEMIAAEPQAAAAAAAARPQKDDAGNVMSAAAVAHRDAYRLRCACGVAWCTACGAEPYHMGRTCEGAAAHAAAAKCRFCDTEFAAAGGGGDGACGAAECRERAAAACRRTLPCGHACVGVRDEATQPAAAAGRGCPPCLEDDCPAAVAAPPPRSRRDDYCTLCYTEALGAAPCVRVSCGHVFHAHCVRRMLASKWSGARISFGCMGCPLCAAVIQPHWALAPVLEPLRALRVAVEAMALQRLRLEGLERDPLIASRFNGVALYYAMQRFAYYPCSKCQKPYYGGMRACDAGGGGGPAAAGAAAAQGGGGAGGADLADLLCPACQPPPPPGVSVCPRHGKDALERKCRYCCSQAVWFCWGTTSFCEPCHELQKRGSGWWCKGPAKGKPPPKCAGAASCPLRVAHTPHGEEFSLGCGECRIASS